MTAKEARELADSINTSKFKEQYDRIQKMIHDEAAIGNYYLDFYGKLVTGIVTELTSTSEGYTVEDNSSKTDGESYRISW